MIQNTKKLIYTGFFATVLALGTPVLAFAEEIGVPKELPGKQVALIGTVVAISDTTITITSKTGKPAVIDMTKVVYDHAGDPAQPELLKAAATGVALGDFVAVFGTPRETEFAATRIVTGVRMAESDMRKEAPVLAPAALPMMAPKMERRAEEDGGLLQKVGSFFGKLKFWK